MFTFNVDQLIQPDWTPAMGDRVFQFDGFISHNRYDGSVEIAAQLGSLGASVWHDEDADLRDRRVRAQVGRALRASRYVIIRVTAEFRDSPWVRSEYRPALNVERLGGLTRAVVLYDSDESLIPSELRLAPSFSAKDIEELAAFIRAGNKLSFAPGALLEQLKDRMIAAQLPGAGGTCSASIDTLDAEAAASSDEFSQQLFILRDSLQTTPELIAKPESLEGKQLRRISFAAIASSNSEDRANGLMLLEAIDNRWASKETLDDLLACLSQESESTLVEYMTTEICDRANRLTSDRLDVGQIIALRSPNSFQDRSCASFVDRLPEVVRCRVHVGNALGGLDRSETMSLLDERLDYLLSLSRIQHPGMLGGAGVLLQISELEVFLRTICNEVLGFSPSPLGRQFSPEVSMDLPLLRRVLAALRRILQKCRDDAATLAGVEEWLPNFMIIPLTLYRSFPELWPDARQTIMDTCDVLESSKEMRDEVSHYRLMLGQLEAGRSQDEAATELQMGLLQLPDR